MLRRMYRRAVWWFLTRVLIICINDSGVLYPLLIAFLRVAALPFMVFARYLFPKEMGGLSLPEIQPNKQTLRGKIVQRTPLFMSAMLKESAHPKGVIKLNDALHKQNADTHISSLLAAHACIMLGRNAEAIELAEASLRQGAVAVDVYYCLALAWYCSGDLATSTSHANRARKLSPKHRGVHALIRHQESNGKGYTPDIHIVPEFEISDLCGGI